MNRSLPIRPKFVLLSVVLLVACSGELRGQTDAQGGKTAVTPPVQYLSPTRKLEKGQAPNMKVQVLSKGSEETTYAVIFGKGDEVLAGLTEFAEEYHLGASRITGIGAIRSATLGWLDSQRRMYRAVPIDHQAEVLSLLGDIALLNGKPVIHAHMVAGFPDGSTRGGHLLEAHVWPTLEVIVTEYPNAMHKKFDPFSGMSLIDPDTKK